MDREQQAEERKGRMLVFLAALILILLLTGSWLRGLLPRIGDAAAVSLESLRSAFAERTELVHAAWINHGKSPEQYLDVENWSGEGKLRIAYRMNRSGWPVDARFVGSRQNQGRNVCERLWEAVLQQDADFEILGSINARPDLSGGGACLYQAADEGTLRYRFSDGGLEMLREKTGD